MTAMPYDTALLRPDRPGIPADYNLPTDTDGLLAWATVAQRLEESRHFWIGTAGPDGRPHSVPVWAVWLDSGLYFGGGPSVRWARNFASNPHASVHLEDGEKAVILEGTIERIAQSDDEVSLEDVSDAYEAKYDFRHPPPFWRLQPTLVLAWTDFTKDATRWRLPAAE